MKLLATIITTMIMANALAIGTVHLEGWVTPTYHNYDFRCINMDQQHHRYRWLVHAKFFQCPEIQFAQEYDYECLAVVISDERANVVKEMTLTRAIWNPSEEFKSLLDPAMTYYFDINYSSFDGESNELLHSKIIDQTFTWGYQSIIIFHENNDSQTSTAFPAICQFKNHFPEES